MSIRLGPSPARRPRWKGLVPFALLAASLAASLSAGVAWADPPDPVPSRAAGVSADREPPRRPAAGETITNSIGIKLAYIPPTGPEGFWMGSPAEEAGRYRDEARHKVVLTQGFYLGVTTVTQAQWQAVMGSNPSHSKGDDLPVETVSWDDAVRFCKKLGEKEGKKYRLPTEAEWEYACRAGTTTAYYTGNGTAALAEAGWFADNSGDARIDSAEIWRTDQANYRTRVLNNHCRTHPVSQKKANAWGLYDMHGNVWQWCNDSYAPYPEGEATDPTGPADPPRAARRVQRGGSWFGDPKGCRSALRFWDSPDVRDDDFGFRVALDSR